MEQKIPPDIRTKLEENKYIHKIPSELGLQYTHKPGQSLYIEHDDHAILDLAADTMAFWVSPQSEKNHGLVTVLENKNVVWKFYGNYARKAVHLFEKSLSTTTLGNVTIKMNNKEKKNVSLLEIFCEYGEFAKVNPNVNSICKSIENLTERHIDVKPNELVKARQFAQQRLDNDRTVLCIFREKDRKLDIFGKTSEVAEKAAKEFKAGQVKMTGRDRPKGQTSDESKNTTIGNMSANSGPVPRASIEEPMTDAEFNDQIKYHTEDTKKIVSAADRNNDGKQFDSSLYKSTRDKAAANMYAPGQSFGTGSRFRYVFNLGGMTVMIYKESIVEVKGVDAIVNAANEVLAHGGGVALYISEAAGKSMDAEGNAYIHKNGPIPVSHNCVTNAGKLSYKGIIHAVGPRWVDYIGREPECARDLYYAIINVLKTAKDYSWKRIGLCAISSGIYGVPKELCCEMYIKALADFSQEYTNAVSEVHFVDVQLEILELIKEAHKKWLSSPSAFDFKNATKYPSATGRSKLKQSVFQRSTTTKFKAEPAPIAYLGQQPHSGGQMRHEFKIYDRVKVFVYTGNIIKLDVDVIGCAVNHKLTGGLANAIAKEAGSRYNKTKDAIIRTWDKKCTYDGYVFFTPGGELRAPQVLHVMITKPIETTTTDALNRFKLINQCALDHANHRSVRKLGIPFIGTGNLKKREDFEKCADSLATCIVEFCMINLEKMQILEIHVVNADASKSDMISNAFKQLEFHLVSSDSKDSRSRSGLTVRDSDEIEDSKRKISGTKISENWKTHKDKDFKETKSTYKAPLDKKNINCTYYDTCKEMSTWSLNCGHTFCDLCIGLMKGNDKCNKCSSSTDVKAKDVPVSHKKEEESSDKCPVCLSNFEDPATLACGHRLCSGCLDQVKFHKPCCPTCNKPFGTVTGTQPEGTMTTREIKHSLPGFENCTTIEICYYFPDGIQGMEHPNPGQRYKGTSRRAFLPNNKEGQTVLKLLKIAFDRRLTFTLGQSRTTGKDNTVTWNDIHHKTIKDRGAQEFGYPDPDYLYRVKDELAAKGITEDSIK